MRKSCSKPNWCAAFFNFHFHCLQSVPMEIKTQDCQPRQNWRCHIAWLIWSFIHHSSLVRQTTIAEAVLGQPVCWSPSRASLSLLCPDHHIFVHTECTVRLTNCSIQFHSETFATSRSCCSSFHLRCRFLRRNFLLPQRAVAENAHLNGDQTDPCGGKAPLTFSVGIKAVH